MDEGRFGSFMSDALELADKVRKVQQRIDELDATASSEDGLITAKAGVRGELLELTLDPRVFRSSDSADLAEAIVSTVHEAARKARAAGVKAAGEILPFGDDVDFDPLVQHLEARHG